MPDSPTFARFSHQPIACDSAAWPVYSLYGVALTSDFPFTVPLPPSEASPVLRIICGAASPPPDWSQWQPVAYSHYCTRAGEPWLTCYNVGEGEVLRLAHIADFYLHADHILCHILDPARLVEVEIRLLGSVLTRWLERRGVPMLHASAVIMEPGAVAFLAASQSGKSTLAASLVAAGCPLLTDDVLPVQMQAGRAIGLPGYPQMRMWPDLAAHVLGDYDHLPLVHPELTKRRVSLPATGWGSFCPEPQPLTALFLPERYTPAPGESAISLTPLSRSEALFTLVGHSFAALSVGSVSHQQQRLAMLRAVAQAVPLYRLRYPSGYEHLPAVQAALRHHLLTLTEGVDSLPQ